MRTAGVGVAPTTGIGRVSGDGGDGRARGIVVDAVVEELREVLNAAEIDAEVTTRGRTLETTVVTVDVPLGQAALLAQWFTPYRPRSVDSRMTLRVGTVRADGGREFGPRRIVTVASGSTRSVSENPCAFPPCRCPQHRSDTPESADSGRR